MRTLWFLFVLLFYTAPYAYAKATVSPVLYFMRSTDSAFLSKLAGSGDIKTSPVTVRFSRDPDTDFINKLEQHGLTFKRDNGFIIHTKHIYLATVVLDSLESLTQIDEILRIENAVKPFCASTLNVSNPQVQASLVWNASPDIGTINGDGIIVTNVDTGIDIYHPGFFHPDGGKYEWIDVNSTGAFENGIDAVDLNNNGFPDNGESLRFFDASFSDPLGLMERTGDVYDADIDWLYNDRNGNGVRDFGPDAGFNEKDPSYGELFFIITDMTGNNRLDPGETLTALGTSRIIATFDKKGKHFRGIDLFESEGDSTNHGTGACGIVGGQVPGRRLVGMAPGVEFISVDRQDTDMIEGILWARDMGTDIIMYEFGSWVFEFLDGTSDIEVLIGDLYDEGIHQFTASGNLTGPARKKHSVLLIQPADEDTLNFSVPESGITNVYISLLWRGELPDPSIKLTYGIYSVNITGKSNHPSPLGNYSVFSGIDVSPVKYTNRMDILITSKTAIQGDMSFVITNKTGTSIEIDAYVTDDKTVWMYGTQFKNHLTDDGTICSPGTAEKGITVGAYDPRGTRNIRGDLNDFSSWGKTIDGRRAVDITAPGTLVYSLTSHDAVGGQPGGYIDYGGTSASLPHVVGCAALVLQASPGISPDELSSILLNGAQADKFTGIIPNDKWGFGKLRVYDSLIYADIIVTIDNEKEPVGFSVSSCYPNPFNESASFDISFSNSTGSFVEFTIYTTTGQRIRSIQIPVMKAGSFTLTWNARDDYGNPVATGLYIFSFTNKNNTITKKALFLK
ncbi:S8 family serine peptidase [Candidatus Latescibacterota bacterium]